MENQEKGLTVNIGEYKGEKPIEVVYRIGNAPKALDELPLSNRKVFLYQVLSELRWIGWKSVLTPSTKSVRMLK
jgi:hypothetical protein